MSKVDDGGLIFPALGRPMYTLRDGAAPVEVPGSGGGLTLRDWLAGQVIAGLAGIEASISAVHNEAETKALLDQVVRVRAEYAYRYADAMLKARSE